MQGHYVHTATVRMEPDGDPGAPGAAITVELCGSWEHQPPCPLAAHHTSVERDGAMLSLRTVFATEPAREGEIRRRIGAALARGSQAGPGGAVSHWTFVRAEAGDLTTAERVHVRRIAEPQPG